MNIPSYSCKEGDVIEVRERSKSLEAINDSLANRRDQHDWLEWNAQDMKAKFVNAPERAQINENIKEQLIVELYSK